MTFTVNIYFRYGVWHWTVYRPGKDHSIKLGTSETKMIAEEDASSAAREYELKQEPPHTYTLET